MYIDPNLAYDIVVQRNAQEVATAQQERMVEHPPRRNPQTLVFIAVALLAQVLDVKV